MLEKRYGIKLSAIHHVANLQGGYLWNFHTTENLSIDLLRILKSIGATEDGIDM